VVIRNVIDVMNNGFSYNCTPDAIINVPSETASTEALSQSGIFVLYITSPAISHMKPWLTLNVETERYFWGPIVSNSMKSK